jgi:phosphoribosylglycinamide formyltransferase 1
MTSFPLGRPARIAVLASGRGSNLAALLHAFGPDEPLGQVVLVISNRASAPALEKARAVGVEALHVPYRDGSAFEADTVRALAAAAIDLVCLAGFMRILSPTFVRRYRGRLLNVHPSLLPAFRGLHAQRQALEAGVHESGCTVHFVDEGVDTGGVIVQRRVPVQAGDSEETLAERIRVEEHRAFPEAVRAVLTGRVRPPGEEVAG